METPPPPERPGDEPASPAEPPPPPPPGGPQAPAGPVGPQPPGAPAGPHTPPGAPEGPPAYGGPVPPGGWEQPIAQQQPGWHGRPLASWGARVGAAFIDALILLIPVIGLTAVVVAIAAGSDTGAVVTGVLGFLAYLVVAFLYAPLLMARDGAGNGQTWGKQTLGIRVIRDSGQPISFGFGALREIAVKGIGVSIASSIIPLIPWLLDVFWPLWDDENRALHDMVVSTHVVQA